MSLCFLCFGDLILKKNTFSQPQLIENCTTLLSEYNIFLLDMWGVLYDGYKTLPRARSTIDALEKTNKHCIILSNNPRPSRFVKNKLKSIGLPENISVVTSGDVTRAYVAKNYLGKKIFNLGQHRNQDLFFDQHDHLVSSLEEADLVVISLYTEQNESGKEFFPLLDQVKHLGIDVLCANPDVTAPHGLGLRNTAGFYAQYLESQGGSVLYMGKPSRLIYENAWHQFGFTEKDKLKTVMIGDTLETDILGANQFGIDSLLVMSGNAGQNLNKTNFLQNFKNAPKSHVPTYVAETI
jgi:HAD superfamily hydrolase (TIGR01459 family)